MDTKDGIRRFPKGALIQKARKSFYVFFMILLASFQCASAEQTDKAADPASNDKKVEQPKQESPWYFFLGNTNNHPRLKNAQDQIHKQVDKQFQMIAPGLDDVKTFADQRDQMMIWTPFIGIGRKLSPRWDAFFQLGYSEGKVHSDQTSMSLLLLPFHLDVTEHRSSFFVGPGIAFFPMGFPELREYTSWSDRLRNARPFLMNTLSWNYLTFEGNVKAGPKPIGNIIRTIKKDNWSPFSTGIGVGVDVPLSQSSVMSFNAQYNFFFDQGDDFSGPGFTMNWKRSF